MDVFHMEHSEILDKDSGEASSDGEDFESADEGEGKEKVASSALRRAATQENDSKGKETGNANPKDGQASRKNAGLLSAISNKSESENAQLSSVTPDENLDTHASDATQLATGDSAIIEQDEDICQDEIKENSNLMELQCEVPNIATHHDDDVAVKTKPTEPLDSDKNVTEDGASGGWSWGSWGAAVFNQATTSVTSGLSHVIEKVETTLGIPEPGELEEVVTKDEKAVITTEPTSNEIDRDEEGNNDPEADEKVNTESFLSSWGLSYLSNAVTVKGLGLVSEGIDALEMIGKKTMNVLSEGDPGLRSKRNMFQKPTLSQVLREAKEKSAKEAAERKKQEVLEKVNFNDEFDRYQGLAHLEALEILSRESETKIESMLIDMYEDDLEQAKSKLRDIEMVFEKDNQSDNDCEGREDGEFAEEIGKCAMALNLGFVPDKLNQTEEAISKWLEECVKDQENGPRSRTSEDIYSHVITSLANITAKSIEVFRKVAEMILLTEVNEETVTAKGRAVHLGKLTKVVTNKISSLSTSYAGCLNTAVDDNEDNDNITPVITEVYLECSNSSSHVQDAFKLLLPILQVSALVALKE